MPVMLWGSTDNNSRDIALLKYLSTTYPIIANKGNKPGFITKTRKDVLDITLFSTKILNQNTLWKLLINESLSDHRYILGFI